MLWDAKFVGDIKITVQDIVNFLTAILGKVFGFIEKEEGWVEEETTNA